MPISSHYLQKRLLVKASSPNPNLNALAYGISGLLQKPNNLMQCISRICLATPVFPHRMPSFSKLIGLTTTNPTALAKLKIVAMDQFVPPLCYIYWHLLTRHALNSHVNVFSMLFALVTVTTYFVPTLLMLMPTLMHQPFLPTSTLTMHTPNGITTKRYSRWS
jgi:hypothetical protein